MLIFSYGTLVTQCLLRDKLCHDEKASLVHPVYNFAMQTREKNIYLGSQGEVFLLSRQRI